jgi:hypothetical protein
MQNGETIHFHYDNGNKIATYDVNLRKITSRDLKNKDHNANNKKIAFRDYLHYKDVGKKT